MTLNKNQFNIKKNESFDKILETNFDNISNLQINVSKIYFESRESKENAEAALNRSFWGA